MERQAREQALAGAREAQAKYEGRRAAEVERLQEWEDVLRCVRVCVSVCVAVLYFSGHQSF